MIDRYQQTVGAVRAAGSGSSVAAVLRARRRRRASPASGSEWILFTQRAVDFGIKDPQFHKDVGFYVFRLPFLQFVVRLALRRR